MTDTPIPAPEPALDQVADLLALLRYLAQGVKVPAYVDWLASRKKVSGEDVPDKWRIAYEGVILQYAEACEKAAAALSASPSPTGTSEVGALGQKQADLERAFLQAGTYARGLEYSLAKVEAERDALAARLAASERMTQSAQRIIDRLEAENEALSARVEAAEREVKEANQRLELCGLTIGGDPLEEMVEINKRRLAAEAALAGARTAGMLDAIIDAAPGKWEQACANPSLIGWFVGRLMKASGGKADAEAVVAMVRARSLKPGTSEASDE